MDKKACLELIEQHFEIKSLISKLKNPDFQLKSHIFYYNNIFQEVDELKILRITSKDKNEDIVFDIYYVSDVLEGLFHGYFRVEPVSTWAREVFKNISRVCTDLSAYFYYAYRNSDLLNKYLIAGDFKNILEQRKTDDDLFHKVKKEIYKEIAQYKYEEIEYIFLRREGMKKYIEDFIKFNKKVSEEVKMFLINIWSGKYKNNICFINNPAYIKNHIRVDTNYISFDKNSEVPIYGLMDHSLDENYIVFIRLEFDFEGGDNSVKTAY
ncbi:hypothetical protein FQB35_14015 [Crassaminicella thermophila]|uniref:Uncharacterized protein n=1 Tax=Crassaminicella thermophila TaxID=2599308 RepID=A0A5C0SHT6_CRATE|nr:hypothetical protein [Crassaminicella thermophila]QEK13296.1 hypothetical protein FQB35_14015 [Crassaminicella thermophila]